MWSAPTPAEREALLLQHAHRFPVAVSVPVRGDAGTIRLPFLVGNPAGSLRPIPPRAPLSFYKLIGAVTLGRDEGDDDELVRDCVLWPEPAKVTAARNQWPGIVSELSRLIAGKLGLRGAPEEVFPFGEDIPPPIAEALGAHPRATIRQFAPPGADGKPVEFMLAIDAPSRPAHDAFSEAMQAKDADRVALVRQFADGVAVGSSGPPIAEVFDRWPGVMLLCVGVALKMAGAAGESRLGEW